MGKGRVFLVISTLFFFYSCSENRNVKEREKNKEELGFEIKKESRKEISLNRDVIQFNSQVKEKLDEIGIRLQQLKLKYKKSRAFDKNENLEAVLGRLQKKSEELKKVFDFSGNRASEKFSLLKNDVSTGIADIEKRIQKKYEKYTKADSSKKDN